MNPRFTSDDICFLTEEVDRLRRIWSKTDILGKCLKLSRGVVLGLQAPGDLVARAAVSSLLERKPLSLVRIGDGEGNALSVVGEPANGQLNLKAFNVMFYQQDLQYLSDSDAKGFCSDLERSVCRADIVGIRAFNPRDVSSFDTRELNATLDCLERKHLRGAHGLIHARTEIERLLDAGSLTGTILTQAWVYLSLIPALSDIIKACERLIVITGRHELRGEFLSRFGCKKVDFIAVPLEGGRRQDRRGPRHFPEIYQATLERLHGDLSGTLVLVGAGVMGKVYCDVAKEHGAVALDIGSAFDILSGVKTRPVHEPEFVEQWRWVEPASQVIVP